MAEATLDLGKRGNFKPVLLGGLDKVFDLQRTILCEGHHLIVVCILRELFEHFFDVTPNLLNNFVHGDWHEALVPILADKLSGE